MSDPMRLRCTGCGTVYDQDIYSCPRSDGILQPVRERRRVSSIADLKEARPAYGSTARLPAAGSRCPRQGNRSSEPGSGAVAGAFALFQGRGRNPPAPSRTARPR